MTFNKIEDDGLAKVFTAWVFSIVLNFYWPLANIAHSKC